MIKTQRDPRFVQITSWATKFDCRTQIFLANVRRWTRSWENGIPAPILFLWASVASSVNGLLTSTSKEAGEREVNTTQVQVSRPPPGTERSAAINRRSRRAATSGPSREPPRGVMRGTF